VPADILRFRPEWLEGVDAVVHLAGLSNDPMAAFSPSLNYVLNAAGTAVVAQACREAGIRRFVFSSTCSVCGAAAQRAQLSLVHCLRRAGAGLPTPAHHA